MENLAALRAAVFSLSAKNLSEGRITAPPGRARVNRNCSRLFSKGQPAYLLNDLSCRDERFAIIFGYVGTAYKAVSEMST